MESSQDNPSFRSAQRTVPLGGDLLRKRWKLALWAGIFLCLGPVLGFVVTVLGIIFNFRLLSMEAPAPGDLTVGVRWSAVASAVGLIAAFVGIGLVVLACIRLADLGSRRRPSPRTTAA